MSNWVAIKIKKMRFVLLCLISLVIVGCAAPLPIPVKEVQILDVEATIVASVYATVQALPTNTPTPLPTATLTPTSVPPTPMPTATSIPSPIPTITFIHVPTLTPTSMPTSTPTFTPTPTITPTPLPTITPIPMPTLSPTPISAYATAEARTRMTPTPVISPDIPSCSGATDNSSGIEITLIPGHPGWSRDDQYQIKANSSYSRVFNLGRLGDKLEFHFLLPPGSPVIFSITRPAGSYIIQPYLTYSAWSMLTIDEVDVPGQYTFRFDNPCSKSVSIPFVYQLTSGGR